jgi:hypothetical protein
LYEGPDNEIFISPSLPNFSGSIRKVGQRGIIFYSRPFKLRFWFHEANPPGEICFFVYPGPKGSEEANYNRWEPLCKKSIYSLSGSG